METNVIEVKIDGIVVPKHARDPGGNLSSEARYLDCDVIRLVGPNKKKIAEWKTPLCPYTRKKLAERMERLAEAVGEKDPLVAQACVLAANLIVHGTLIPPGASVDLPGAANRGSLGQFRILNEEDVHGRSETSKSNGTPPNGSSAA